MIGAALEDMRYVVFMYSIGVFQNLTVSSVLSHLLIFKSLRMNFFVIGLLPALSLCKTILLYKSLWTTVAMWKPHMSVGVSCC